VTEVELNITVGPMGDTEPLTVIVPEKPLSLVSVIVAVPVEPWPTLSELGLELRLKA